MQGKLNTDIAFDYAKKAIKDRNIKAIEVLAESFPRAIAEVLQLNFNELEFFLESTTLIFQVKEFLPLDEKQYILHKLIPKLLRYSKKIFYLIDRSKYPTRVPYSPGIPWDLENTILTYLLSGESNLTYKHVICREKKSRDKNIILLIDTSHSVLIHLKFIILTSILFTMTMNLREIAIISFDTHPKIIKAFSDLNTRPKDLIQLIMDIRSGGKTDIFNALKVTNQEFSHRISSKKTLIMVSDLLATSGLDFFPILKRMSDVRIIVTPRRQTLQLTAPLLGKLRRLPNIKLYRMPSNERRIPNMLEKVLFD